jgi:hypothetical protein
LRQGDTCGSDAAFATNRHNIDAGAPTCRHARRKNSLHEKTKDKENDTMRGSLSSMLAGISGGSRREKSSTTPRSLDAVTAALRGTADRMSAPNPFRVGDIVTIRPDADVKGRGEPHVVVEIIDPPVVNDRSEPGSNNYLRRFDLRVAHYIGDSQTIHAIDHSVLEPWTQAHADAWTARQTVRPKADGRKVSSDTPMAEVMRVLREEAQRRHGGKIDWKKGDLVEIVGHEVSNAAKPMQFAGRAVGFVETVDRSDDTTKVVYFDDDGDMISQWFKICDLAVYRAVEPVAEA